ERLQGRHDFARREYLNLELVVGGFRHELAEGLAASPQRVERLRPARRQPPFELGHRLRDGRRCDRGGRGEAEPRRLQKFTTLHDTSSRIRCSEIAYAHGDFAPRPRPAINGRILRDYCRGTNGKPGVLVPPGTFEILRPRHYETSRSRPNAARAR